jgi:hypothetical protein
MYRNHVWTALSVVVGAALLSGFALRSPHSPLTALAESPAGSSALTADLGAGFTYQGSLLKDGEPLNGSCDFEYRLFDQDADGTQVGGTQSTGAQSVSRGRVNTVLDFGADAFDGQARWMEIRLRCPEGSGSFETLTPRQPLTGAPYAHSLRPDSKVEGSVGATRGILNLKNNGNGNGLSIEAAGGNGLFVKTTDGAGLRVDSAQNGVSVGSAGQNGLKIETADTGVFVGAASTGLQVNSATGNGLSLGTVSTGVRINEANNHGLHVAQAGGNGIQVDTADGAGLNIDAAQNGVTVGSAGQNGIKIDSADTGIFIGGASTGLQVNSSTGNGVSVGTSNNGLHVREARSAGVLVEKVPEGAGLVVSEAKDGVSIGKATGAGVLVDNAAEGLRVNTAGGTGVRVVSSLLGFYAQNVTDTGLRVDAAPAGNGVYVGTGLNGIFVDAATNWTGLFDGNVNVTGTCTGCLMATFGLNTGGSTLNPGDVVSLEGMRSGEDIGQPMLMDVGPARAGAALVGVVHGRAVLSEDGAPDRKSSQRLAPREGAAKAGDYVHIVIYGPVHVRASALTLQIAMGDKLSVNDQGAAQSLRTVEVDGLQLAQSAPTIGMALEDLEASKNGLIWVLVNPQ